MFTPSPIGKAVFGTGDGFSYAGSTCLSFVNSKDISLFDLRDHVKNEEKCYLLIKPNYQSVITGSIHYCQDQAQRSGFFGTASCYSVKELSQESIPTIIKNTIQDESEFRKQLIRGKKLQDKVSAKKFNKIFDENCDKKTQINIQLSLIDAIRDSKESHTNEVRISAGVNEEEGHMAIYQIIHGSLGLGFFLIRDNQKTVNYEPNKLKEKLFVNGGVTLCHFYSTLNQAYKEPQEEDQLNSSHNPEKMEVSRTTSISTGNPANKVPGPGTQEKANVAIKTPGVDGDTSKKLGRHQTQRSYPREKFHTSFLDEIAKNNFFLILIIILLLFAAAYLLYIVISPHILIPSSESTASDVTSDNPAQTNHLVDGITSIEPLTLSMYLDDQCSIFDVAQKSGQAVDYKYTLENIKDGVIQQFGVSKVREAKDILCLTCNNFVSGSKHRECEKVFSSGAENL